MSSTGSHASDHVLLVEDHTDTREAVALLLQLEGFNVVTAPTLAEARRLCADHHFDIILCDVGLPDGSGLELPRWVKPRAPKTKLIALTGHVMRAEIQAMHDAGFDLVICKPVLPETLRAALLAPKESPETKKVDRPSA